MNIPNKGTGPVSTFLVMAFQVWRQWPAWSREMAATRQYKARLKKDARRKRDG